MAPAYSCVMYCPESKNSLQELEKNSVVKYIYIKQFRMFRSFRPFILTDYGEKYMSTSSDDTVPRRSQVGRCEMFFRRSLA